MHLYFEIWNGSFLQGAIKILYLFGQNTQNTFQKERQDVQIQVSYTIFNIPCSKPWPASQGLWDME